MKTNIISIASTALFAIGLLSPMAVAGPKNLFFPHQNISDARPAKTTDCCVVTKACTAKPCCGVKSVANSPGGRSGSVTGSKSVRACGNSCEIPSGSQHSVCREGTRA